MPFSQADLNWRQKRRCFAPKSHPAFASAGFNHRPAVLSTTINHCNQIFQMDKTICLSTISSSNIWLLPLNSIQKNVWPTINRKCQCKRIIFTRYVQPNLDLLPLIVNLPDFNHFLELGQVAGNLLTPNKDRLHLLSGKGGLG